MSRMYHEIKTWNPQVGCKYDCIYCKPSFKRLVNRTWYQQGRKCSGCRDFLPHEHPNRLKSFPSKQHKTVWSCAHGDITFGKPSFIRMVIAKTKKHPDREFYFQSKNPDCFRQYLSDFLKPNTILLTTLETNRDEGYRKISQAPLPSKRFQAFRDLNWKRKIVTVEPVLDFDEDVFGGWIKEIHPELVWIGYNSHPNIKLPEPSLKKTKNFIDRLRAGGIQVREKLMREKV